MLSKAIVETTLDAELDAHIGFRLRKHQFSDDANSRNCYSNKVLKTEEGDLKLMSPVIAIAAKPNFKTKVFDIMALIDTSH